MFTDVHATTATGEDASEAPLTGRQRAGTVAYIREQRQASEAVMALRFIGIDPTTGTGESPTVWVDDETWDVVVQSYEDEATTAEAGAFTVPGHAVGVPKGEAVVRIPARMVPALREACDAIERAQLR
jgi:hypothetical protein